ncbi:MAG TPA: hypothetical protein ACN46V_10045, partial [Prochlorococcus sp.]
LCQWSTSTPISILSTLCLPPKTRVKPSRVKKYVISSSMHVGGGFQSFLSARQDISLCLERILRF